MYVSTTTTDHKPYIAARLIHESDPPQIQLTLGDRTSAFLSLGEAEQVVAALTAALPVAVSA